MTMTDMGDEFRAEANDDDNDNDSVLDKLRDSPVGTNDPMIVGDVGPTDIPPGSDGDVDPLLVSDTAGDEPDSSEPV